MSPQPPAPKRGEEAAIVLLALPYLALQSAGRMIGSTFKSSTPAASKPQPTTVPAPRQQIPAPQTFVAADRVFSATVNGQKVSLLQYFAAKFIRITCRERRIYKEVTFTPAIATQSDLPYDIDGAIQWFRKNGFDPRSAQPAAANPARSVDADAKAKPKATPARPAAAAAAGASRIVNASGPKAAPFTGIIRFFGEVTRRGREDDKSYVTYAMKLETESGSTSKEFIGEHLADLVSEMNLETGQLVTVRLIGKHHFEVEVDGKLEARSRNHFEITPHEK